MIYSLLHIVRSKCPSITPQDKKDMMDCTDWMIEQGMYTDNELTPKYQTHVMLFRDDAPAIWLKLREEFYQACRNYLEYSSLIFVRIKMHWSLLVQVHGYTKDGKH